MEAALLEASNPPDLCLSELAGYKYDTTYLVGMGGATMRTFQRSKPNH